MGRADRVRRELQSRRLSFRPRRAAGPATRSPVAFVSRLPRLAGRARAAAARLAVLAALLALPLQAGAQTVQVLVSNTGQSAGATDSSTVGVSASGMRSHAQKFTTGGNEHGYALDSVQVYVSSGFGAGDAAKVGIHAADASGKPGGSLYVLTGPASIAERSLNAFAAPADATLDGETDYFVVLEAASGRFALGGTESNAEDADGAGGWRIHDRRHSRGPDSADFSEDASGAKPAIAIRGIVLRAGAEDGVATRTDGTTERPARASVLVSCEDDNIWCATMTVRTATFAADGTGYCITGNNNPFCGYGSVDEDEFLVGTTPFTVRSVRWVDDFGSEEVHLTLNSDLPSARLDSLTLKVGTHSFALSNASTDGGFFDITHNYKWPVDIQDFADIGAGDEVTVQLLFANSAPVFGEPPELTVDENTASGTDIGSPVTADDSDGDTLAYGLSGPDAASFDIVGTSGQLRTKAALDHEAKPSHALTVTADDGNGGTAEIAVTVTVTDVDEPPGRPAAPTMTRAGATSLAVVWQAPSNTGRPAIDSYDLRYRVQGTSPWTNVQDLTVTNETLDPVQASTNYQVQVRATNAEGDGRWSPSGIGNTDDTGAAGKPTISGSLEVGQILTAETDAIVDGDGLTNPVFRYLWRRYRGTSGNLIQSATSRDYTLRGADSGARMNVVVSFDDDAGNAEEATSPFVGPVAPRQVAIAAEHARIGAGIEDLVFTLTRRGDPTAALEGTVTVAQDRAWLGSADLSHTASFAPGSATAALRLGAARFSLEPPASGDLTATFEAVEGQGTSRASTTVEMISIAGPAVTLSLDMNAYTVAEDAGPGEANVYIVAKLDRAYPRAPTRELPAGVGAFEDSAKAFEDWEFDPAAQPPFSGLYAHDYELESGQWVARRRVGFGDGVALVLISDDAYEGYESFVMNIQAFGSTPPGLLRLTASNGRTCDVGVDCPTVGTFHSSHTPYRVTITDEGDLPPLSLGADRASIAEEDDDATADVTENASTVTALIGNHKTFAGDETITLIFVGSAVYGTDYSVTPADADANAPGHQVALPAGDASVRATVTAIANDTFAGARVIAVTGWRAGTDFGTATIAIEEDDKAEAANEPPVFDAGATATRRVAEDTGPGVDIGAAALGASDGDGDTLAYSLEGTSADAFAIDPATGLLRSVGPYDHEELPVMTFFAKADDGNGGTARVAVTVTVTDVEEQAATPAPPAVRAPPGTLDRLDVRWAVPGRAGGPAIAGYELRYRIAGTGAWTEEALSGTATAATLPGLAEDTVYSVQVRALNGEIASEWSPSGIARTGPDAVATGEPRILGVAWVGETLTADITEVMDAGGIDDMSFAYRWLRVDTDGVSNETAIAGATDEAYTLTGSDAGKRIRVEVTFSDDGGYSETLTSAATSTVRTAICPEVWCATLTVKNLGSGNRGCANSQQSSRRCSNASVLTEDEFTHDATGYAVTAMNLQSGGELHLWPSPAATARTATLVLTVGSERFPLARSEARPDGGRVYHAWPDSGLSWSVNDEIDLKLVEGSTIATLRSLDIEDGDGNAMIPTIPPFSPGTDTYAAPVDSAVAVVTVAAEPTDAGATVEYLDGAGVALDDADANTAGHQVTVNVGDNVIVVEVTAEDGVSTGTYTVTVRRPVAADANANLRALSVSDGALRPFFDPERTDYTALVLYWVSRTTLEAEAEESGAAIEYLDGAGGALADLDPVAAGHQVALALGATRFGVRVAAADGTTTKTYTVTVTRALAPRPDCEADAVWCTSMTMGGNVSSGGYCGPGTGANPCNYGAVDDDGFALGPTGYTVESVRWEGGNVVGVDAYVNLTLDEDFPSARTGSLTLQIGAHEFALGDAGRGGPSNNYRWTGIPEALLGLNAGAAVTVQLRDAAPELSSATVVGTELVLVFDEPLAAASALANAAFAVKKTPSGGSVETVGLSGSPSIDGATVTLTLDEAVASTDRVTVSYTKPSTDANNRLEDAAGNEVADFTDAPVTNNTAVDNDTAQVMGVGLTAGNGQLAVNWTAVANATGYQVQWKSGSQGYNSGNRQAEIASGTTTGHTITGLANGTEYTVRVRATRTGFNDGAYSVEEKGTPGAAGVTLSETMLTVTEEDTTGDTYTAVLDRLPTADVTVAVSGHTGTEVTPAPASLTFTTADWDTPQTVTVTAGDDSNLDNESVTLQHTATSTDSDYDGISIDDVTVTVVDNDTAQVMGLVLTAGNAQLAVNWTAVGNATGYEVQWKSGSQGYNSGNRQAEIASGTTTGHTITGLANGTEYTVRVRATRTGFNDGAYSEEKNGTPGAAGVTLSETMLTVTEEDTTGDTYTAVLDRLPTADVTVAVSGHTGTEVTPAPASLTFTTADWDTPQTVTVTAGDDSNLDNESVTLQHTATSTDSDYDGISIDDVTVTVVDNDTAQVMGLVLTAGNAQLAVNWTAVGNATGYEVQWKSGSQGYNSGNRQAEIDSGATTSHTITGLDNGTEYTVKVRATRTGFNDGAYSDEKNGTPGAAGVTLSETALTVTEEDTTGDTYTVVLDRLPTADVTVAVSGHAGTAVTPSPASLTFTTADWDTPQTVTVTAGDDSNLDNESVTLQHTATSTDSDYDGISIDDVTVTVVDNDTAQVMGLVLTAGNAQLAVNWTAVGNATGYEVQWKSGSQGYNSGNRQAEIASGTTTGHTITGLANGTEYTVRVRATRTGFNDGAYSEEKNGTPGAAGVTLSETMLTVTEEDTTGDTYTAVLDRLPTADVTVAVSGHTGTEVTPAPASLTFTTADWDTPQTVTVTAGDDSNTTDETVTLQHTATSTDSAYSGISIDDVVVTVEDNDVPNTAPTAEDSSVRTDEDVPYTFEADNFGFADDDGDALASVIVVTLPGAGVLKLNGSAVGAGQEVAVADIEGDGLVYEPPESEKGTPYASFKFRVSDGTDESADATMTIDVTPVNDPATGAPVIEGTARVDETLTAAIGTIADVDGLPDTFPDDYAFQWVRVTGTTETNIGTPGPDNTYTPAETDEGMTLKVKVTFTDDDGNPEGPLTSEATAAVAAAAAVEPGQWGDVRLVDAQGGTESGSGRLEVFYRGRWGTVCDDRFDRDFTVYGPNYGPPVNDKTDKKVVANQAAAVACQKMSYATGAMVSGLGIGLAAKGTKIWLDDVRCAEEEADWRVNRGKDPEDDDWRSSRAGLHDCYHAGIKLNNCTREENVHLQCVGGEAGGSLPELTGEMEQDHEYHEYHYGPGYPFTVRIGFSEAVERDKVRAAMTIETATGSSAGSVQGLAVVDGDRRHWEATIAPTVREDITVSVTVSTPCHEDAGVCTGDGRRLDDFSGATRGYSAPLTAQFRPPIPRTTHDGSPFEVRLVFSVTIRDTFAVPVSPDALEVTDGTIEGIARAADGLSATVTIEPESATKDVGFHLKERHACSLAGAICKQVAGSSEHPLLNPLRLTFHARPGTSTQEGTSPQEGASPLTARFADVPVEHDGKSAFNLRLEFSEAVFDGTEAFDKNKAVRDALVVSGGTLTNARRVDTGAFDAWWVRVKPSGNEAVTISLGPAPDCAAAGALCTPDGRALSNGIAARVQGPAGLAVADARVDEGPGAALAFEVTLDRARQQDTSVDYATEDGSAEAGADYVAASGTLRFAPGETAKTVAVTVLDDAHDEGDETLILRLSNPSGAYLADAEAIGTIENTDAMPRAWLARFGRTVAELVLDAVQERMRAAPRAGAQVTLAGHRLGAGTPDAEALEAAEERARPEGFSAWLRGEACGGAAGAGAGCPAGTLGAPRTMTVLDLLSGSSFALTGGTPAGGYATLWGRGALSSFDGRVADAGGRGALTIAGEVVSVMLGADWAREHAAAGVLMSHAWGDGSYRGADSGEVAATLTGLYPWGSYAISDRVTVWGAAGYGVGTLPLTLATGAVIETDIALALVAAGLRGIVIAAPAGGGPEVAVKTDALAVRTSSDAVGGGAGGAGGNLAAATADVTRLRLGLEGTWRGLELGTLEPRIETGVRYDDGDAETGFGLDLGGGLAWSDPATGVDAEVSGRGLLTHESAGFGQLGFAGRLGWNPRPDSDRGPNLTLTQTVGLSARGGMDALLGRRTLEGLAAHDDGDDLARRRLEFALGYGFPLFGDRFTSTPELGFAMTAAHREYRLGWRLAPARGAGNVSFDLGIEATRRESVNGDAAPEHAAGMQLNLRW